MHRLVELISVFSQFSNSSVCLALCRWPGRCVLWKQPTRPLLLIKRGSSDYLYEVRCSSPPVRAPLSPLHHSTQIAVFTSWTRRMDRGWLSNSVPNKTHAYQTAPHQQSREVHSPWSSQSLKGCIESAKTGSVLPKRSFQRPDPVRTGAGPLLYLTTPRVFNWLSPFSEVGLSVNGSVNGTSAPPAEWPYCHPWM